MKIWLLLISLVASGVTQVVSADESLTIAGHDVAYYAGQVASDNRVVRLRAVKTLGAFGVQAGDALVAALENQDPAVRYTAAVHLGRIGGKPLTQAVSRLTTLRTDGESLAVQQAAAYALCRSGAIENHLSLLIERAEYPERAMALSAIELLGMLGRQAAPAVDALEQISRKNNADATKGDHHLGNAAAHALAKIRLQP